MRACILVGPSEFGIEHQTAVGYSHPSQEFDQNSNGSHSNHGYLCAAKDSYTTFVNGEVIIHYFATGGSWIRAYGLYGGDRWTRPLRITDCEMGEFEYSANATMSVLARAALTGFIEYGDVYAYARASLRVKIDDVTVAFDNREVKAGTIDLDHPDQPDIVTGAYTYAGKDDGGLAKQKVAGDGANPAEAKLEVSVSVPTTTKKQLELKVFINSFAQVKARVPTSYGWAQAWAKHKSYPNPNHTGKYAGDALVNGGPWYVKVRAYDLDDPVKPVLIRTFEWTAWGDTP